LLKDSERAKFELKKNFKAFKEKKGTQDDAWSVTELASLIYTVVHLGEGDWKSLLLEGQNPSSQKKLPHQIALKWRDIKFWSSLILESGNNYKNERESYLAIAKSLLSSQTVTCPEKAAEDNTTLRSH
jgi:hypothetical protein